MLFLFYMGIPSISPGSCFLIIQIKLGHYCKLVGLFYNPTGAESLICFVLFLSLNQTQKKCLQMKRTWQRKVSITPELGLIWTQLYNNNNNGLWSNFYLYISLQQS